LRLFVNGRLVCESSPWEGRDYPLSNETPLRIGFGAADYFEGTIDDLRIYRRALGADEIARQAEG
jgi:hypothetical protein